MFVIGTRCWKFSKGVLFQYRTIKNSLTINQKSLYKNQLLVLLLSDLRINRQKHEILRDIKTELIAGCMENENKN